MFGWLKGKSMEQESVVDNYDEEDQKENIFDTICDALADIKNMQRDLNRKLDDLTDRVERLEAPAEKFQYELEGAKRQLNSNSDFMQKLVLQLIETPRTVEMPKASSTALQDYLAKKAANGSAENRPKLP